MNIGLLLEVRDRILAHPENYNQGSFCGTVCCIAGHMVFAADGKYVEHEPADGFLMSSYRVRDRAAELLGTDPNGLFGTGIIWPPEHYGALFGATTPRERAQAAADAIIDFIITDGWTKEADPSKLVLAEQAAAPETTAELIAHQL